MILKTIFRKKHISKTINMVLFSVGPLLWVNQVYLFYAWTVETWEQSELVFDCGVIVS